MDTEQVWNVSVFLGAANAQKPEDRKWFSGVSGCNVSPAQGWGAGRSPREALPSRYQQQLRFKLALM